MDEHGSTFPRRQTGSPDAAPIRIAIVDDHQLMAEALALVLGQAPDLALVGSADTCAAALDLAARTQPDVLLLDISLPDGDGLACVPALQTAAPGVQILVLTSMTPDAVLLRAIEAGVAGFVGKQQPLADVQAAIRQVAAGEMVLPAGPLLALLGRRQPEAPPRGPAPDQAILTARECEILALVSEGKSTATIATALFLSQLTVRTHIRNATGKLNAHSRLEAVAVALRQGLIARPRLPAE